MFLGTRDLDAGRFVKTQMYDDGLHNDGASGDGLYGAEIVVNLSDIQYYIYAENTNTGMFSPERAEYEYHILTVEKGIVINEIMAENNSTVTDQDGEYDDWIELYNNTSTSIDLSGFNLSDNTTNLAKWTFPQGTIIDANDYLIVWADDDLSQSGLHASFKLSASGESVILSDNSLNIIDQFLYGNLTNDISFGRYPNGNGTFTTMNPTYDMNNSNTIIVDVIKQSKLINLYPNPSNNSITLSSNKLEDLSFTIYNSLSQRIYSGIVRNNHSVNVNIESWQSGMYFVHFENGEALKLVVK